MKITEEYAMHIARDAYFWGLPLVNVYNKRLAAAKSTQLAYAGPVPSAPLNRLVMLTDYVAADERIVACPNQDVAYGGGSVSLELTPVVIQVPDFGDRFWVYQAVDTMFLEKTWRPHPKLCDFTRGYSTRGDSARARVSGIKRSNLMRGWVNRDSGSFRSVTRIIGTLRRDECIADLVQRNA